MLRQSEGQWWRRRERGQALVFVVLMMTVVFVVGAIVVDVGLWLSERRGAQTDADLPALAGAWELLPQNGGSNAALTAVDDWADNNNESANLVVDDVVVDDSCFNQGTDDSVTVEVTHDSYPIFLAAFGFVDEPGIRARAKACAGAATGVSGLVPLEVDNNEGPCFDANEQPIFTQLCPLEYGAQAGNPRGILDLEVSGDYCSDATGPGDIESLIEWGAPGSCFINTSGDCDPNNNGPWYDCVGVQTGNPKKVLDGMSARVARDGGCDATYGDGDGLDEFDEIVQLVSGSGSTGVYEGRDCDLVTGGKQISSRLITIVVLEDPPIPGNVGYEIVAFAGFYVLGCTPEGVLVTDQSQLDTECVSPPAVGGSGPPGHSVVWGQFVTLIVTNQGGVSAPNDSTTIFGIALVE